MGCSLQWKDVIGREDSIVISVRSVRVINPDLYGVFLLPILYGGRAKKPPCLTLAFDFR